MVVVMIVPGVHRVEMAPGPPQGWYPSAPWHAQFHIYVPGNAGCSQERVMIRAGTTCTWSHHRFFHQPDGRGEHRVPPG